MKYNCVEMIHLEQDITQWRAVVNTDMNFWLPKNAIRCYSYTHLYTPTQLTKIWDWSPILVINQLNEEILVL